MIDNTQDSQGNNTGSGRGIVSYNHPGKRAFFEADSGHIHRHFRISTVHDFHGNIRFLDELPRLLQGHGGGTAVHVRRNVWTGFHDLFSRYRTTSGNGGPAGMHHDGHPFLFCPPDHGRRIFRFLHAPQPDFSHHTNPFTGHLRKVFPRQSLFKDQAASNNLCAAGPEIGKGLGSQNSQGLRPCRVFRSSWKMHLPGGNKGGHSPVNRTVQKSYLVLPRRPIPQDHVAVGVNQSGRNCHSATIYDPGPFFGSHPGEKTGRLYFSILNDDPIAFQDRVGNVPAHNGPDIFQKNRRHLFASFKMSRLARVPASNTLSRLAGKL